MDTTGTCIKSNVVAADDDAVAIHNRMLGAHQLKIRAIQRAEHFPRIDVSRLHNGLGQFLSKNINLPRRNLNQIIFVNRVDRDCKVARQRPSRSRPNDKIDIVQ